MRMVAFARRDFASSLLAAGTQDFGRYASRRTPNCGVRIPHAEQLIPRSLRPLSIVKALEVCVLVYAEHSMPKSTVNYADTVFPNIYGQTERPVTVEKWPSGF